MSTTYSDLPYTSFPDEEQEFTTMADMTVSDASAVKNFQAAMEDGDSETAQTYYEEITDADTKFLTAEKLNTLMQTCIALQRFYSSDIEDYIEEKEDTWQSTVDQLTYIGVYSSSTQYYVNNIVSYTYDGVTNLYLVISQPSIGVTPLNTTYWRQFTIQGAQGVSGDGVSFRGEWSSSVEYYVDDLVTYDENLWACLVEHSNQEPNTSSSYWSLLYESGQIVYPFQSDTPSDTTTGYLWFEITG